MTRALLSVAPHPDDELLGAPATLMALRDQGWRVVNLACSLGRPSDASRRRDELREACSRAGFELVIPDRVPPIGRDDDLELAQRSLARAVGQAIQAFGAELLVGPSPHDVHHGHEVVGRAIRDAVEARDGATAVMFWGLWGELPLPNVFHPFGAERLAEIQRALAAHAGELARARVDVALEARARMAAVLGAERVFGFGVSARSDEYAELLTGVRWRAGEGWRLSPASEFDPLDPIPKGGGREIGWWLRAASVRSQIQGN